MAIRCLPYPSGESLYSHNSFSLITMNVLVLAIASVAIGAVNDLAELARTCANFQMLLVDYGCLTTQRDGIFYLGRISFQCTLVFRIRHCDNWSM